MMSTTTRIAIYADMTIAFVNLYNRPATFNTPSTEAFLAPQLMGGSSLPRPKRSPLTSPTSMSKSTTHTYRTRRFVDKRRTRCTSRPAARFLVSLRSREKLHARPAWRSFETTRTGPASRSRRSAVELPSIRRNCSKPSPIRDRSMGRRVKNGGRRRE